jgi:hypothetical protein
MCARFRRRLSAREPLIASLDQHGSGKAQSGGPFVRLTPRISCEVPSGPGLVSVIPLFDRVDKVNLPCTPSPYLSTRVSGPIHESGGAASIGFSLAMPVWYRPPSSS